MSGVRIPHRALPPSFAGHSCPRKWRLLQVAITIKHYLNYLLHGATKTPAHGRSLRISDAFSRMLGDPSTVEASLPPLAILEESGGFATPQDPRVFEN
jgi:hypothetical protein